MKHNYFAAHKEYVKLIREAHPYPDNNDPDVWCYWTYEQKERFHADFTAHSKAAVRQSGYLEEKK